MRYITAEYYNGISDRTVYGTAAGGMCIYTFFYDAAELYRRLSLRQRAVLPYRIKPCAVHTGIYGKPVCQDARYGSGIYAGCCGRNHMGVQPDAQ